MATRREIAVVGEISGSIKPLLYGIGPDVQGAVLADLTATWLAGFMGPATAEIREELLQMHIRMIRELIPVCEAEIAERQTKQ